ncbi:hypothetical protein EVAR_9862_1 [Eumeta japonica]|uniref:MADF domain-containing protein n=1 Tax=Eumeta variegata TaxID=151549 RepID=A0A4C1TQ96_EUMVA|nr:hypothetical protein EVAR_9862_1 [Eumeta japonica]
MTNNMSTEETFRFIELYQAENCLWNPKNKYHKNKNVINDSWNRIANTMGVPIHELKKKKDNLLATFRLNLKRIISSMRSGAGAEEVYQPVWIFYDVLAAFFDGCAQPVVNEESSTSNVRACDIPPEVKNGDNDDADVPATFQKNPCIQGQNVVL